MAPEFLWPLLILILACAIAIGWFKYATRDKVSDPETEAATRRLYETPTRDDQR